jgi:hypothetical protein
MKGGWEDGDIFYLMTDALACWFLMLKKLDGDPVSKLNNVQTQADFENLVEYERANIKGDGARMLKNDDVTLLRCSLSHPE